jgi:tetratricopeptide (TPR) repeat protein
MHMSVVSTFLQKLTILFQTKHKVLFIGFLTLATFFTYGNSVFNDFVWDDHDIIVNNITNRDMSNIATLFLSADSTVSGNQKTYYRPLNRLSYMLDYQLFGLHPAAYHLENIAIHLFAVILIYLLAQKLLGNTTAAFMAALIFAVHPVNAEAVNFISARNTLLSTLFVLLAVIMYIDADAADAAIKKNLYYSVSGLFFFMSLLCKEPAIMLLIVLFFYEMSNFHRVKTRIREKIFDMHGLWKRLAQNMYIVPQYASVILYPIKLKAFYSLPKNHLSEGIWLFFFWIVVFAGLILFIKKTALTKFGLLWLAINVIPISNIVPIPSAPMAERYLYLPAIGLWLIAADQFHGLYEQSKFKKALIATGLTVVCCFVVVTINRNVDWHDSVSFFSNMVETNPDSAMAHYNLGLAYAEKQDIVQAQSEWKKTAGINPRFFNVYSLLGESYLMCNLYEQAEYYYTMEVKVNPDDAKAAYNLAVLKEKLNKPKEALMYYELFLKIQPQAYANLIPKVIADVDRLKK